MAIIDKNKKAFIVDRTENKFVGIDMPFRLSETSGSGYFAQTSTTIDAVKNNVRNLLNTEKGERLLQPELGLNLRRFIFENITEDTKMNIQNDIISNFSKWLPFVEIKDIQVDISESNSSLNTISINLSFSINRDPNSLSSVQVEIGE